MRTFITSAFFLLASFLHLNAQSVYRAGEISVRLVGDVLSSLSVVGTIYVYTDADAENDDTIEICWGDGTCEAINRINGQGMPPQGEIIAENLKLSIYQGLHTYPAIGTYVVSTTDCCWTSESLNILNPGISEFRLFSEYTFTNPQYQGANSQPIFLQPGVDEGLLAQPFTHNPNAYDVDGDSLAYGFFDLADGNYILPDQVMPGPDNVLSIDAITGDITWDSPQQAGKYHLFVTLTEYREGIPIGKNLRVMEIDILDEVVGLFEQESQNWKTYPNPAKEVLTIEFPKVLDQPTAVQLNNLMGQTILEKTLINGPYHQIELDNIASGMYLLKIQQGKYTQTKTLIIH